LDGTDSKVMGQLSWRMVIEMSWMSWK